MSDARGSSGNLDTAAVVAIAPAHHKRLRSLMHMHAYGYLLIGSPVCI
jgi:hypothetical protein